MPDSAYGLACFQRDCGPAVGVGTSRGNCSHRTHPRGPSRSRSASGRHRMRNLSLHGPEFRHASRRSGHGDTDAFPASEFPTSRSYDAVVALSRSGTTTEVLRLLETLRSGREPRTFGITADADTPLVELADHHVILDFADEKSVCSDQICDHLPGTVAVLVGRRSQHGDRPRAVRLTEPLPPRALDSAHFTFLGSGMSVGLRTRLH